tara:strand:+ start:301 stop:447 length:147 start_codon:yes stop_codon:yes gene_type:complete
MKKPFKKLLKNKFIINYRTDMSAKAPTTLAEPDLSFKEDHDPHFWRGK